MKVFLSKNKKIFIDILIVITVLLATSGIVTLILSAFGVITFDGGMRFNLELFNSFKNSWYGWIIFIIFQSTLTALLCIIPGCSMAFILLSNSLYEYSWQAFVLSFVSVMISSTVMYLIGRVGGYKLCIKLLGKEDCDKSLNLLREKGTIYFPLMMMFPIFPDDALVMMAGTIKMKLKWFIPSIVLGRGIGIFTIIFGLSIVPFERFTSLYDWLVFVTVCAFWIFMMFKFAHKFNAYMEKKKNKSMLANSQIDIIEEEELDDSSNTEIANNETNNSPSE